MASVTLIERETKVCEPTLNTEIIIDMPMAEIFGNIHVEISLIPEGSHELFYTTDYKQELIADSGLPEFLRLSIKGLTG